MMVHLEVVEFLYTKTVQSIVKPRTMTYEQQSTRLPYIICNTFGLLFCEINNNIKSNIEPRNRQPPLLPQIKSNQIKHNQ